MGSEKVFEFTDDNFENEVIQSDVPVLVDIGAEWCMPCRMIAPIVEELAADYEGRVKIGSLDVAVHREWAMKFGIEGIPTLLLFKGGQIVKKVVGLTGKRELAEAIDQAL